MGQKVHPVGFRLGVTRGWDAKWFAEKGYASLLQEDLRIRKAIAEKYAEAGISRVEISRNANQVTVSVHTARPGIVIGRGGQRVDEMRKFLEQLIQKQVRVDIQEIRQPELEAYLVAKNIAEQLERRVAYRRAIKQAAARTLQSGAKGIKIAIGGRLAGAEIARREKIHQGRVPLHTLRANIDFAIAEAHTAMGCIGVKVWIYKGDILTERHREGIAEAAAEVSTVPVREGAAEVPTVPAREGAAEEPATAPQTQEVITNASAETSQVP